MAAKRRKKVSSTTGAQKRRKSRRGLKIMPPQKITFVHPKTREKFEATISVESKTIHPL